MEQNIGMTDRYIRLTLGGLMLAAGAARMARRGDLGGTALGLLGGMMLAEGILGTCPLYQSLGVNTNHDAVPAKGQGRAQGQPDTNDIIQPYEGI